MTVNEAESQNPKEDVLYDLPNEHESAAEHAVEFDAAGIEDLISAPDAAIFEDDELAPLPDTAALRAELDAAENRALRAYADLDNYKKRFQRELDRQRDQERDRFLNSVLSISDNLRRALDVPNAEASPYRDGLMTVMRQIENVLRDFNVEPIPAEIGRQMDPNIHEAVTTLSIPGKEHGSIVAVTEPGFKMGDRVLRPTKVVVVKNEED
jgi:molecular chaperone GrpE